MHLSILESKTGSSFDSLLLRRTGEGGREVQSGETELKTERQGYVPTWRRVSKRSMTGGDDSTENRRISTDGNFERNCLKRSLSRSWSRSTENCGAFYKFTV